MTNINQIVLLAVALILLPFLQSCNDDDDSGSGPTPITYPNTITFSHFENIDFKMFTNGAEVNTDGMDFLDYVEDSVEATFMAAEYYESINVTFTEDSIFSTLADSLTEGYPYFISNDSIYSQVDGLGDVFMGLGSPTHLKLAQGFSQYCYTFNDGTMMWCGSTLMSEFKTLEWILDDWSITSIADIQEGDTLIISNRYVHYK